MALGDRDRLWSAREVARAIARVLDAARRAPTPSSPSAPDRLADVVRSLGEFTRRYGRLQLRASTAGLALGAQPLPDEQGRFLALATEWVVGGVRDVIVEPGVTDDEVVRFLEALGGTGDDVATRLLDAGLDHVEVRTREFAPGLERPDGASAEARAALQHLQKQAEERARAFETGHPAPTGVVYEVTDTGGEFARLAKLSAPAAPRPAPAAAAAPVEASALLALRARAVEASSPDAVLLRLVDHALHGLALDPDAIRVDEARWFLELAPDQALRDGDLALLAAIVERYHMELTVSGGVVASVIQGVLQALSSSQGLERVIAVGAAGGDAAALCTILEALGDAGVQAALAAHQRTTSRELKKALAAFLAENVGRSPELLQPLLAPTASTDTAKFALFLVSRSLEGQPAEALYEAGRAHPQPVVSEYATLLWRTRTLRGRLAALLESLEKDDVAGRIEAVGALARAKDQPALELLVKVVQDRSFLDRTPEEMQAFLNAIAAIGGQDMVRFFEEQAGRSSGLFRMRAGTELRTTAKEMLKRLGEVQP